MVRVLVVEDEANIRDMIALNLRHAGMEVVGNGGCRGGLEPAR